MVFLSLIFHSFSQVIMMLSIVFKLLLELLVLHFLEFNLLALDSHFLFEHILHALNLVLLFFQGLSELFLSLSGGFLQIRKLEL